MLEVNIAEEYLRALHKGQKEKKKLEAEGKDPYPAVLSERFPEAESGTVIELPTQEIPVDRIAGTRNAGRSNAFSASFLPLLEIDSEFAAKWMALCEAHFSDEGIRDPIECCEYLGDFYVAEGNKRLSVLKYFGGMRISARIRRILPTGKSSPEIDAYYEFVEFHRATGLYDVQFKKPGEYARLYAALGKKPGDKWSDDEITRFSSRFHYFKEAFTRLAGGDRALQPEEALLLFLKVHTYESFCKMPKNELKKALTTLWGDVQASSVPAAITVMTQPGAEEKKGVIGKLITAAKHLNVAFIYQQDDRISPWAAGHVKGAEHLAQTLKDSVRVNNYFHADTPEEAEKLLDEAIADGAELVFTTTPPLLAETLKAALKYPKVRFFNCSACQPFSSVRSYYCRTYEGKFITGLIAGALAENDLVGYVGSYPILGVPASINAFALGVRMTNPRAKVLLEWSCLPGNCVDQLRSRGVRVISNRDIPLPDVRYMYSGSYGTFLINDSFELLPFASPCWIWGRLYEKIVRSVLAGSIEKKEQSEAVNYWWGMDSGVIDVTLSDLVPDGVKRLAEHFTEQLKSGLFDPFSQKLTAQDGSLISGGEEKLSSLEIMQMNRLSDIVDGRIPEFGELLPMSKTLVRELGGQIIHVPPESEDGV